ncbi:MAG: IS3 family transposase [archaeon]
MKKFPLNRKILLSSWKIPSSSYYYKAKSKDDSSIKEEIEHTLAENPYYGHRRIAMCLGINKKCVQRVMQKYFLHCQRKKKIRRYPKVRESFANNLLKDLPVKAKNQVWATDFTYLKWRNSFVYFSTVIDVFTRELKAWNLSTRKDSFLVLNTIENTNENPQIMHSDHGLEYVSSLYQNNLKSRNIQISMSNKGHPWENGYQESFYSRFKAESGGIKDCKNFLEIKEKIRNWVEYYNKKRIHTALKMPPQAFRELGDKHSSFRGT